MATVTERYERLKSVVVNRKEEFDRLIDFMENETEFLTAPASTRFHMSKEGGLLEHSVNVCENMLRIKHALAPSIDDESCVIVALIHDLGKVGIPGKPQYIKNRTADKSRYGYSAPYFFNNNLTYLSVPVRSIYLALPYIHLSEEEVQAVIYHDGQYVDDNKSVATKECPLLLLLQFADSWSAFVTEK